MKKLIIMNGCGGSGKDTFVRLCRENSSLKINKFSIIDFVKEQAALLGWSGGKTDADRKFLSDLNDALADWNDSPFQTALTEIREDFSEEWGETFDIVFIDIRDPDVIDRMKNTAEQEGIKVITVLVERKLNHTYGNHADDNVHNYLYDYVIDNAGTLKDLGEAALTFMESLTTQELLETLANLP